MATSKRTRRNPAVNVPVAKPKTVSLTLELCCLVRVLAALRDLLDAAAVGRACEPVTTCAALATLVRQRLEMVRRAVDGEADPLLVWCPENEAGDVEGIPDVVLRPWSSADP